MINNTSSSRLSPIYMRELQAWHDPDTFEVMPSASIDLYDKDMRYRVLFGNFMSLEYYEILPPIVQDELNMR